LWALAQYTHFAAMDNPYNPEENAALFQDRQDNPQPLGDLPLIVLSRSRDEYPKKFAEQLSAEHKAQQADLATLSSHGQQIIVPDSGHHIQLDQPEAVVRAIEKLLSETKAAHSP